MNVATIQTVRMTHALGHSLHELTLDFGFLTGKTHANDLNTILSGVQWNSQQNSLTLKGMRIDGTYDDIRSLSSHISGIRGTVTLENITSFHTPLLPVQSTVPLEYLMGGVGDNRIVRLKNCPWAIQDLDMLDGIWVQELLLEEVKDTDLVVFLRRMKRNKWITRLEIRNIHHEGTTVVTGLAEMLKHNNTLRSLTVALPAMHDSIPILEACQVENRTLKDLTFIFSKVVKPSKPLIDLVTSVAKHNTVIENLSFRYPNEFTILKVVNQEADWYLDMNHNGRETLRCQFGTNDNLWFDALVKCVELYDDSTTFYLLKNNPAVFFSRKRLLILSDDESQPQKRQRV